MIEAQTQVYIAQAAPHVRPWDVESLSESILSVAYNMASDADDFEAMENIDDVLNEYF